jgi:hypothetical protein
MGLENGRIGSFIAGAASGRGRSAVKASRLDFLSPRAPAVRFIRTRKRPVSRPGVW